MKIPDELGFIFKFNQNFSKTIELRIEIFSIKRVENRIMSCFFGGQSGMLLSEKFL